MLDNWLKISLVALKSKTDNFIANGNNFKFRIFKFKNSSNGFMTIWNSETLNAFTISRMKITTEILTDVIELDMDTYNPDDQNYLPENLVFEDSKPY
ncbi:hypothetical protein ABW636_19850 [Aquimarina sp. 2201CG1-2-11]|uniref:hypothetical protein n=1 Tax=Aquimarina discodermiae TaxID=3231043 RepID=UPI0034631995